MSKITDALLVGFDHIEDTDNDVLLVGKKVDGVIDIINAFKGEEAKELYEKLTGKRKDM